ncbi:A24 family peptidase [Silvibacterium dinghuense]|uniref:Prepilin peptidase n=1 Tax=Silvibacterium dinghuense TaxID=1560006 RepID=A0A4Q1S9H9_9BACT|nr:prepilin peptidase [Silvibacterium dinghuense]RXS93637.1 prepilin peptidase [Silvibacterium dinghuense]GGH06314.1 type 4 prepilin peptidase 1 [Silvibacterium dinghuense]
MMQDHQVVFCAAASAFAGIAAVWDVRTRRIPNLLCLTAFAVGILLHFGMDGWSGMLTSLAAGLIAGFVFFLFFLAGGMGGGDVKLIAAIAALAGFAQLPYLLVFTALTGGVLAMMLILRRGALRSTLKNMGTLLGHHLRSGLKPHEELNVQNQSALRLPYGIAIAAGACITLYLQGSRG